MLINQASVMAAGGFPYVISQPGSYRLSGNLTVPSAIDGIDINAANVTLDLNGFSVTGPATCTFNGPGQPTCTGGIGSTGVLVNKNASAIRNGKITGFGSGIVLIGIGHLIEETQVFLNQFQGISGNAIIIRRSLIMQNGGDGIDLFENGVVENNLVESNGGAGIFTLGAATVIGNTSTNNGGSGIVPQFCLYGSNSFLNNAGGDISTFHTGGVSQNNNNCSGTQC